MRTILFFFFSLFALTPLFAQSLVANDPDILKVEAGTNFYHLRLSDRATSLRLVGLDEAPYRLRLSAQGVESAWFTLHPEESLTALPVQAFAGREVALEVRRIEVEKKKAKAAASTLSLSPMTPDEAVSFLLGDNCVSSISNIQAIGDFENSAAYFSGGGALGIEEGLVFTTGRVSDLPGPNSLEGTGGANFQPGDPDIELLTQFTSFDASGISFDFVAESSTLDLEFVFGSEEYCEWITSQFNDAFGIFLSGPGIDGPYTNAAINLAVLPTADQEPINVNSINNKENQIYFRENAESCGFPTLSLQQQLELDGITTVLSANQDSYSLIPGETYHLKVVIADVSDYILDAAIFMKSTGTFNSNIPPYAFIEWSGTGSGYNTGLLEECADTAAELFIFKMDPKLLNFDYSVALNERPDLSTAENGLDLFVDLPDKVTIPAGEWYTSLPLRILDDELVEGAEQWSLECTSFIGCDTQSYIMTTLITDLDDKPPFQIRSQPQLADFGVEICLPQAEIQLIKPDYAAGRLLNFTVEPVAGVNQAEAGLDYQTDLPAAHFFAPHQDTLVYELNILADGVEEGVEHLVLEMQFEGPCGMISDTVWFELQDEPRLDLTLDDLYICDTSVWQPTLDTDLPLDTPWLSFAWNGVASPELSLPVIPPADTQTYVLTIEDYCGQSVSDTALLIPASPPSIELVYDTDPCAPLNEDHPTLVEVVLDGEGPLSFSYTFGGGAEQEVNTMDTSYTLWFDTSGTLTITGGGYAGGACPAQQIPAPLEISSQGFDIVEVIDLPGCDSLSPGQVLLQPTLQNASFFYEWEDGTTGPELANLFEGSYAYTVTNAAGCTVEGQADLLGNDSMELVVLDLIHPECYGEESGYIAVLPINAAPPFTYEWSNGADQPAIGQLPAGNYTLTVTNESGCSTTFSTTLSSPPQLMPDIQVSPALCPDQTTGQLVVEVEGGLPPYTLLWSTGDTTATLEQLLPGDYGLTVTDANGCTHSTSVTVEASEEAPPVEVSPAEAFLCEGESVTLSATPGFAEYFWSNGESGSASITVSGAGIYSVEAITAAGCVSQSNVAQVLLNPTPQLSGIQGSQQVQIGEIATYAALGGHPQYTYNWSAGSGGLVISGQGTPSATIQWGTPGPQILSVTAVNEFGCQSEAVSIPVTVGLTFGAGGAAESKGWLLAPNPAGQRTRIFIPEEWRVQAVSFRLFHASGRVLKSWLTQERTMYELDISDLPAGVYWITAQGEAEVKVMQLVKKGR